MKTVHMVDADGKEIKLFSGVDALNALDMMMSLHIEHVADDDSDEPGCECRMSGDSADASECELHRGAR